MPKTYDSEFRRRVVELIRAGRSVTAVCAELGLAEATAHRECHAVTAGSIVLAVLPASSISSAAVVVTHQCLDDDSR